MKINLGTESLARAAARRPWLTVAVWCVALVGAFLLISTLLNSALTKDNNMTNHPESMQANAILDERMGKSDTIQEMVILQSATLTVDDHQFKATTEELFRRLTTLDKNVVLGGVNYYMTQDPSLVSADRHSTLINLTMPLGADTQVEKIYQVSDEVVDPELGLFSVYHTGTASFNNDIGALAESTMKTGETLGIGVALIVLAIVFGALAAAILPIALGIVAIVAALGLTALAGQVMDISFTVTNMISMMGLAVGIDYSLFILTRFREERKKGLNKIDAIAATGATASRAIFFSGLTVLLALTSLVIFPMTMFQTMGVGALLVVLMAIVASLTLLPAVLSLLGDRVNSLRIPLIQKAGKNQGGADSGFWAKTTRIVTRRPVISLTLVVIVLVLAIVPYFGINTGMSGITGIPDDLRAKKGFLVLQKEFHLGMDSPAVVVVDGDANSSSVKDAVATLQNKIASNSTFSGSHVATLADKNLTVVYAVMGGDPLAKTAMDAVSTLRSDYIPAAFAGAPAKVLVTGETAGILDFNQTTNTYTPIVFGVVLSLSFIILLLAFRSVVIPATAIIMNLLSVGASYGLLVLVFQKGVGASIFGFHQVDVIESWLPLFLFALLFGLSMDYHVFLLSRIRENYKKHGDTAEAVSFGLRSTGKLITGAALIMVAVFGGFALGDMVMFQQMGFGLAVAVFLDATLIRTILVPATMKLLGKYNWYLPKWLEWIPNVSLGEQHEGRKAVPEAKPQPPEVQPAPLPAPIPVLQPVPVIENAVLPIVRKIDLE
jgi:RND superfamily putative drug exporter